MKLCIVNNDQNEHSCEISTLMDIFGTILIIKFIWWPKKRNPGLKYKCGATLTSRLGNCIFVKKNKTTGHFYCQYCGYTDTDWVSFSNSVLIIFNKIQFLDFWQKNQFKIQDFTKKRFLEFLFPFHWIYLIQILLFGALPSII